MSYKIEHIDTKRLWRGFFPCADITSEDGQILVGAGDSLFSGKNVGVSEGLGSYSLYTADKGDTWEMIRPCIYPGMVRFSDGKYFSQAFGSAAVKLFDKDVQDKIPYVMKKYVADSFEQILENRVQIEFECVDIPELAVGYGDSQDPDDWATGYCGTGAAELDNGDVLLPMYGHFKADRTKLSYFKKYDFYQYRTWILVSHDKGKSFEYLSTVADCQSYPFTPDGEGFCEPSLLNLGGGHVLCAMRTQGHEVYSPLFASHSYDNGKTWSRPEEISPFGVYPRLLGMKNGLVVCTSGKWDTFLCVSEDGGHTWSDRHIIAENDGQWDRGPSGYTAVFEVEPDVILVVYDHTEDRVSDFKNPYDRRVVYATRYKITKES